MTMTNLEWILLGLCAILWVLGWHAALTAITINEQQYQVPRIRFILFLTWPMLWLFIMFFSETAERWVKRKGRGTTD